MLAEEMELVGYIHACRPPAVSLMVGLGIQETQRRCLRRLRPRLHVSVTFSVRTSPGQPQFKGRKESPPLLDRVTEARGKG